MILRLMLVTASKSKQTWGLLRLPVSEMLAHGDHQGWFYLSDVHGEPFRDHQGEHASLHIRISVEEREAGKLRNELDKVCGSLSVSVF